MFGYDFINELIKCDGCMGSVNDFPNLQKVKQLIQCAGFASMQEFAMWCGLSKAYFHQRSIYDPRNLNQKHIRAVVERGKDINQYIVEIANMAVALHCRSNGRLKQITASELDPVADMKDFVIQLSSCGMKLQDLEKSGWKNSSVVPKWGARFVQLKKLMKSDQIYPEYIPETLDHALSSMGMSLNAFAKIAGLAQPNLASRPIPTYIVNLSRLMHKAYLQSKCRIDFSELVNNANKDLSDPLGAFDHLLDRNGYTIEKLAQETEARISSIIRVKKPQQWVVVYLSLLAYLLYEL